ncbi:DUF222 domain-containing protein [uncultured Friedmanniella sp.]|uniref:HNH endonuclease signature motif containing protein n=1 Tax=uncultured Friedmanniella sp. TaxID=335381 RepID=UPI0035CBA8B1
MVPEGQQHVDEQPLSRAHALLTRLDADLSELIAVLDEGDLGTLNARGMVDFLQQWERHRNQMAVVDHLALTVADTHGTAAELAQPNLAQMLVSVLRLSASEAHRRVRAAEAVGPRTAMTGEQLEPVRPVLAAAQRNGDVSPEQVQVIVRALAQVDRAGYDRADIDAGEAILTQGAETFEPKELSRLAARVVEAINPDGTLPDVQLVRDRRHLSMRCRPDGGWVGEFRLTGVAGAKLAAVLEPLAKPRTETVPDPDGQLNPAGLADGRDERSHGQRMHDALEDVCDQLLRAGELPASGGTPATVIVTITEQSLRERTGVGYTAAGNPLTAAEILDLAEQADVIPTVLTDAGAVEAQGRNRRIATTAQTWALIARDGGCSFPSCDRAPQLCERHHIVPWVDGGHTDLDNLTLLCRWHHHQFEQRGWSVAMNRDRLPAWTPPKWVDRQQRPLLHTRLQQQPISRKPQPWLLVDTDL